MAVIDLGPLQRLLWEHRALDVVCALGALACAVAALRGSWRRALWTIPCAALLFGLPMLADPFLHDWDERYHALVARSLLAHPLSPTLWEAPLWPRTLDWPWAQVWLHKPPLAALLMALSRALFGPAELALRVPSLLLHAAASAACAALGPALLGRARGERAGRVGGVLYALCAPLLLLASGRMATDHPDSLVISLTAVAGLCAVRAASARGGARVGLSALCGAATGAAVLAKSSPGMLALGVLGAALAGRWRWSGNESVTESGSGGNAGGGGTIFGVLLSLGIAGLACAAVALPWALWTRSAFPAEAAHEAAYALRHFTVAFEGHVGGPLFHLAQVPRFFGWASPLGLGWLLWSRRLPARVLPVAAVWIGAPYLVFSLAATKMEAYPLLAAPLVCLLLGEAAQALWERASSRPARALAAALVLLPLASTVAAARPLFRDALAAERTAELRALAVRLGPGPGLIAPIDRPVEVAYYTGWTALDHEPTRSEREEAQRRGWRVEGAR